jgi:hypothetical protein
MTILLIILSVLALGTVALVLGLCRAAADVRDISEDTGEYE